MAPRDLPGRHVGGMSGYTDLALPGLGAGAPNRFWTGNRGKPQGRDPGPPQQRRGRHSAYALFQKQHIKERATDQDVRHAMRAGTLPDVHLLRSYKTQTFSGDI